MVQYKYDAWGNHAALYWNKVNEKEQCSEVDVAAFDENYALNKTLAELNPFRYRGYYYDTETIDASYTGKKITAANFFASMAKGIFVGASLYGIGALMGFNGWGLKPKLNLIDKGFYYGIQLLFKNALKLMNPYGYEGF